MPDACVVFGCNNIANKSEGIAVHKIPFFRDNRPECVKRRKIWIDFVSRRRAHWAPTKNSVICSLHFRREDFVHMFANLPGQSGPLRPRLKRDELGLCVYPTIQANSPEYDRGTEGQSDRTRRKVIKEAMIEAGPSTSSASTSTSSSAHVPMVDSVEERNEGLNEQQAERPISPESASVVETSELDVDKLEQLINTSLGAVDVEEPEQVLINISPGAKDCSNCDRLRQEKRQLTNQVKSLRSRLVERRKSLRTNRRLVTNLQENLKDKDAANTTMETGDVDADGIVDNDAPDDCAEEEVEDGVYETETETDATTTETETEDEGIDDQPDVLTAAGKNLRTEPKHIVFLSQLLLLFNFCHVCKTDNPSLETKQVGTKAVVTATCSNPKCPKQVNTWHSQPMMPGSAIPAGNFLLCMAILLAGGSATKVFQIFSHMGLGCVSLNTFFKHQRSKLFPTISIYWQKYQAKLLEKVKAIQGGIAVAGDGRHDSMGHSAKYGAYTIFCCTLPMILHFALIQRNQAGNSPAMEFMGFKQCMEYLLGYGILITTFISDRHLTIASHMKKVLTTIVHYFDIWHLKKKIRKVLSKLSKEKGCEELKEWIKPCENHLYWSALSTFSGNGKVIWAKFKTFMSHIINTHSSLADPVFNKCGHGDIHPRKWLHADSVAYDKLCTALTNNSLMKGIKQASPFAQTSCLEGFHSLLNQFAPKMIAFSYVGMYCRHILAAVHFNFNLQRGAKYKESDGTERVRVSFPKFKNGEATVRDIKITPNFEYVEEIFQTYLNSSKDELTDAASKLKNMTPAPMNTMVEKQAKDEAIEKRVKRAKMVVEDVPPTITPEPDQPVSNPTSNSRKRKKGDQNVPRKARCCSACKKPMKGHQNVLDCPKNRK